MSAQCEPTDIPPIGEIDVPAILEKYAQERERRLRPEGQGQYREPAGAFADICEADPHTPVTPRDSLSEDIDVAVLGGGFAGVLAGYHLRKAGVSTFRTIDHAGDFGGCWYWNRYPGVECDNVSYVYFPLLEEMGYMPSKKFAPGYEIREYIQSIARKYGLYDSALFHTQVTALRWDESIARWRLSTNRGDEIRARFVVMGVGPLNKPKLPNIPGLDKFRGKIFHSSRWDYDYSGGSQEQPHLDRLADQRIAVVGTGASAVQIVPYLGRYASQLYVIQRTPSSVDARDNTETDPDWAASLEPGWHQRMLRNFQAGLWHGLARDEPDQICDIWTEINRNIRHEREQAGWPELSVEDLLQLRSDHDHRTMERLRRRVDSIVEDRDTAERLKPYYRFLCKRPCSNDFYYPTFNRPNVELLDVSATRGIEALTENGFIHEGREYPVDCIILASGYEQTSELKKRWAFEAVEGSDGQSIYDYWQNGYQTLHGMSSHGFPNQFYIGFIQGAVHASTTETWNRQAEHIAYLISQGLARGATRMEPTTQAQAGWVKHLHDTEIDVETFQRQCTPGYYNNEGGEEFRYFLGEAYGPGPYAFWDMLEAWRADGQLDGFSVS
ncbi:NAD(P)/FAD-dependent oxidoreductase [Mangrovimicrobium sediminis]|uniref:NAD(P)/FAD-dependent oxidoreductase n=1 Tax=Mangrovimicrobium sediminis TaxID=2562682 RepID=A0A4Z0M642_9GAMM|nr:NAD(P)/FAD-dependent oxidoreductase [Haliea sp. SAOS-164]TGD74880.1 NAD(P)/FAD-dependent oxidoreductase [Haliea sp. SAOS-164]